ncbi:hypothetical protein THAOC_21315, partial [Thalassiosira oceanica]
FPPALQPNATTETTETTEQREDGNAGIRSPGFPSAVPRRSAAAASLASLPGSCRTQGTALGRPPRRSLRRARPTDGSLPAPPTRTESSVLPGDLCRGGIATNPPPTPPTRRSTQSTSTLARLPRRSERAREDHADHARHNSRAASAMSAEYARTRQRGGGDGATDAAINPAKTSATSSADPESMLKQALARIDSLERQHEEMKTSMERETKAMRGDICILHDTNKALQASTERQIESLMDDVNSLQSENKALKWSLNRLAWKAQEGWEYPVAIQPDEYWQSKGYDHEAIRCLKVWFFEELKTVVPKLEHGVCDSITVGYVNHDKALVPHWNALFRSFKHINPYDSGVKLHLQNSELNEELMWEICNHVRHRNISQVSFCDNEFTNIQGAIIELGNALKSPQLKSLTWSQNPIESVEDMNLFTRVLTQSNSVDKLKFTWNGNENTQALLSGVNFSRYKLLNLGSNTLQTNGRTDIPDLIATNPPLESLNLFSNRLNDDDAVLIAQSLGANTHLTNLNVRGNNMQERGMRALYEAVNDTSTLNALSDGNHSCRLEGLSDDFDLYAINWDRSSDGVYMNRMCKIHILMVDRYDIGGGNVPHLNTELSGEDSVLLAPYLMESVVRRQ